MSAIVWTILAAILLMFVVVVLLGIGWLITGKITLNKRGCGSNPQEKTTNCKICGEKKTCKKEKT